MRTEVFRPLSWLRPISVAPGARARFQILQRHHVRTGAVVIRSGEQGPPSLPQFIAAFSEAESESSDNQPAKYLAPHQI